MNNIRKTFFGIRFWFSQHPTIGGSIGVILFLTLWEIIKGIISNSLYDFIKNTAVPFLREEVSIKYWFLILFGLFLFSLGIIITQTLSGKKQLENYTLAERSFYVLRDLGEQLQISISEKSDERLDEIIDFYFECAKEYLSLKSISGGAIILPESTDSEWLHFWRMSPGRQVSPKRFYVGSYQKRPSDENPRGMAGNVFLSGKPEIVRLADRRNVKSDNPKFHVFNTVKLGISREYTPYLSGINLPIRWQKKVVGVLSFESDRINAFDEESIEWLQPIADFIGTILFEYDKL